MYQQQVLRSESVNAAIIANDKPTLDMDSSYNSESMQIFGAVGPDTPAHGTKYDIVQSGSVAAAVESKQQLQAR